MCRMDLEGINSKKKVCVVICENTAYGGTKMLCRVSDQSLDFLSHMSICRKHFSCFLHNLKNNIHV